MRAIDHHLYERNGYLYYRSAFPRELKTFLPVKEVRISLGTQDRAQARLYVAKLDLKFRRLIEQVYALLNHDSDVGIACRLNELLSSFQDQMRYAAGLTVLRHDCKRVGESYRLLQLQSQKHRADHLISKIFEDYLNDCITNTKRTIEQKRVAFKLFIAIIGDIPIFEITKEHARRYKSTLLKLPTNYLKQAKLDSYAQVDWNLLPENGGQSCQTINSKIIPLNSLMNWAIRHDLYQGHNPFSGLMIKEVKNAQNKRLCHSEHELNLLFGALCRDYKHNNAIKDYHFWIPFIGFYSSLRLNEICQLERQDIENIKGIWCFNINANNGKSLKTASSERIVPIHGDLIEMGFLDFVKEKKGRIFDDLSIGYNGSYSYTFTKWYSRYLSKIGIKKKGLCFHSFRHNFIDGLRNEGVERDIIMRLVGHVSSKDVHAGYGLGYNLPVLRDKINMLKRKK